MTSLLEAARELFGPSVGIGVADPRDPATGLIGAEVGPTSRMREKRLREFAAGRRAAREAMADAGLDPFAVPMGKDRAPVWPQGIAGSIAHHDTACLAVLSARHRAIGVDLEPALPLPPETLTIVCTAVEREWLGRQQADQHGILARLIFSAKECFYKAQYPLSGQMYEFDDVSVAVDLEKHRFVVADSVSAGSNLTDGCFARCDAGWLTMMILK